MKRYWFLRIKDRINPMDLGSIIAALKYVNDLNEKEKDVFIRKFGTAFHENILEMVKGLK